jgi:hypothetical protein
MYQHATEITQVWHGRTEPLDSAADHEFLIEYAGKAKSRVGFSHDGTQHTVHPFVPFDQFVSAKQLLRRLGSRLQRCRLRQHQLAEEVGRRRRSTL